MKLYFNTSSYNNVGWEAVLRSFRLKLDFMLSLFWLGWDEDVGFMLSLNFSKNANLDAYMHFVFQFWRLHITMAVGPMSLHNVNRQSRVLQHEFDGDHMVQHVFVFQSRKEVAAEYVCVITREPGSHHDIINYEHESSFELQEALGGSLEERKAYMGWKKLTLRETQERIDEARAIECYTKDGIEPYPPFTFVRGRDFQKYFL